MTFKHLFSPLKIGKVEVRNRISFQPHLTNFAVDCLPTERHMHYWGERARGGVGLIITEEMSVHPTDRAYEKLVEVFHPEVIPPFRRITDRVHEFEARIFAQLNHNGQQCDGTISRLPVWPPRRWSPRTSRRWPGTSAGAPCTCGKGGSTGWSSSSATPAWRASS